MDEIPTFGVVNYVVLAVMLCISAGIGIFYACTGGRQSTTSEFLLANRKANPIPVAFSLVASFVSAITVLAVPADVYFYGARYWLFCFAFIGAGLISSLFQPVFLELKLTSANEYLELRFHTIVRLIGSAITFVTTIFYMAVVIYTPALALSQVTGVSLKVCVVASGTVCTFYTTIGGLKAVLWTDVFQMLVMMAGLFAIIIQGTISLGGMENIWRIADEGNRLDFWSFDVDPTVRHTFWTITIGGSFAWGTIYGASQAQVMRYLSCGTLRRAQISLCLAIVGMVIAISAACLAGLVLYAHYAKCDPFLNGKVSKAEQYVPLLVSELFHSTPGIPGLFTAAVLSAALSTVSSGLSALTVVTTEDILSKFLPVVNSSEKIYVLVNKFVALCYGALCIGLAFAVANIKENVLQISLSVGGMFGGPGLGLFTLGMFFPHTNTAGAISGVIVGLAWSLWVGIGYLVHMPNTSILSIDASMCPVPTEMYSSNLTDVMNLNASSQSNVMSATLTTLASNMTVLGNMTNLSANLTDSGSAMSRSFSIFVANTSRPNVLTDPLYSTTTSQMTTLTSLIASSTVMSTATPITVGSERVTVDAVYRISYIMWGFFSWLITVFVGIVVSLPTGRNNYEKMNPAVISPLVRKLCPRVGMLYEEDEVELFNDRGSIETDMKRGLEHDVTLDSNDERQHINSGLDNAQEKNQRPCFRDISDPSDVKVESDTPNGESFDTKL